MPVTVIQDKKLMAGNIVTPRVEPKSVIWVIFSTCLLNVFVYPCIWTVLKLDQRSILHWITGNDDIHNRSKYCS